MNDVYQEFFPLWTMKGSSTQSAGSGIGVALAVATEIISIGGKYNNAGRCDSK